jgi:phage repressor protein C with HTH and peptisase S24 domain
MPGMSVGERIKLARKERDMTQKDLGDALGVGQSVISEMEAGKLKNWPMHAPKIMKALGKARSYFEPDAEEHIGNTPDLPDADNEVSYVRVEVLPTFAGLGGGGTGDGAIETALVSRRLVEDELRARPTDLLLINVRGDSMEPMFHNGDQLLIDRRDTNPIQPGPFALLYSDGYVVKIVSWVEKRSKLRIASANKEYEPELYEPDEVTIMGRPVWFARRL